MFLHFDDEEFQHEGDEVSKEQAVPNSQEHQGEEMRQILVAQETKALEDIPKKHEKITTGIQNLDIAVNNNATFI